MKHSTYQDVDIYITTTGKFYANPQNNSEKWIDKLFYSEVLSKLHTALDDYCKTRHDPIEYVSFGWYGVPEIVNVVQRTGNMFILEDGQRKKVNTLFKLSEVKDVDCFKSLLIQANQLRDLAFEIDKIRYTEEKIRESIREITDSPAFLEQINKFKRE